LRTENYQAALKIIHFPTEQQIYNSAEIVQLLYCSTVARTTQGGQTHGVGSA